MSDNKVRKTSTSASRRTCSAEETESASETAESESSSSGGRVSRPDEALQRSRQCKQRLDRATGRSSYSSGEAAGEGATTRAHELRAARGAGTGIDWQNDPAARELAEAIDGAMSIDSLRRDGTEHLEKLSVEQMRKLRRHPDKLRNFIAERVGSRDDVEGHFTPNPATGFYDSAPEQVKEATNDLMSEIEGDLMRELKTRIADKMAAEVDRALAMNRAINDSPESRRRFLAGLATNLDSPQQVEKALREQGFSSSDAASIGEAVEGLQNDRSRLETSLDPSTSSSRVDRAARTVKSHYDESNSDLQTLQTRIENDENNAWNSGRKLLTDANYKYARASVFEEFGIDPELATAGTSEKPVGEIEEDGAIEQLVREKMNAAQEGEAREQIAITGINLAASLATAGIGGIAVGAGMAAASNAPELSRAQQNMAVAEAAVEVDMTDETQVGEARAERNAAVAATVFDLVAAGAGESDAYSDVMGHLTEQQQVIVEELAKKGVQDAAGR